MFQNDSADVAAVEPVRTAIGTTGFFTEAGARTVLAAEFLNMLMKELNSLVTVIGGLALDKADDTQLQQTLGAIRAIISDVAATGTVGNDHKRVVIAANSGSASGLGSAAIATTAAAIATGAASVVVASSGGSADGGRCANVADNGSDNDGDESIMAGTINASIDAVSFRAAIIASQGQVVGDMDNAGNQSAIMASRGLTAAKTTIDATSVESAIIASQDVQITAGDRSAAIGVDTGTVGSGTAQLLAATGLTGGSTAPALTGDNAALIAAAGDVQVSGAQAIAAACDVGPTGNLTVTSQRGSAISCGDDVGSQNIDVTGNGASAVAVKGSVTISGAAVVVASDFGAWAGTISQSQILTGGNSSGPQWELDSSNGQATLQKLDVNDGVALGATPAVLGNLDAPGPATAAQNQWLEISINGTPFWVPVWA